MSANPDDENDFFASDIGPTRTLAAVAANAVSTGGAADVNLALPPGKYLIQRTSPGGADLVFIGAKPFVKDDVAWATLAAAAPLMPMVLDHITIHVRKGHSDRIFVRTTGASTATVYITQISRVAKKTVPA